MNLLMNMVMDWSIDSLLNSVQSKIGTWGQILVVIIGLVMVIAGVFKIAKGLMSHGQGQVNWVLNIALILIGGVLAFGSGWAILEQMGTGTETTLNELGQGTIVMDVDSLGITTSFTA